MERRRGGTRREGIRKNYECEVRPNAIGLNELIPNERRRRTDENARGETWPMEMSKTARSYGTPEGG